MYSNQLISKSPVANLLLSCFDTETPCKTYPTNSTEEKLDKESDLFFLKNLKKERIKTPLKI
ncbi:MAG: hypothetical protein C0627_03985 [Sulfurimonas sp.]|nr:MAG: hypothetical protein C0627_03985 [Sulfurimonas sp.]